MLVVITLFILLIYKRSGYKKEFLGFAICLFLLSSILGVFVHANVCKDTPSAIDVYRGRTKLEITEIIRDSTLVSRDSIVVFK